MKTDKTFLIKKSGMEVWKVVSGMKECVGKGRYINATKFKFLFLIC